MPNPQPYNSSALPALDGEVLARLRDGHPVFAEVRRLINQGVAPAAATEMLRAAYTALVSEREVDATRTAARVYQTVARSVVEGRPDAEITRDLAARGVTAGAARTLIVGARSAWRRRQQRPLRVFMPVGGERLAVYVVVLFALLTLNSTYPLFEPWNAASGRNLTAVVAQPSMQALMIRQPNAVVIARHLNVRVGPNPDDPVMLRLMRDMQLEVIAKARDLQRLKVKLPDNREGWVRNDPNLLKLVTSLDSIPIAQ